MKTATKSEKLLRIKKGKKVFLKLLFLLPAVLLLMSSPSQAASSITELILLGDDYYARRADGHDGDWASTVPISKALEAYLNAYELGGRSAALYSKILRASFFYATNAEKDESKQKEILQRATVIGAEAVEMYPDDAAINYQMAGCWGRWGEVNGLIASARKGVADKVKLYGEKTIRLDPDLEEGGGYRTMGRLHFKAPYIPFILSWPDKKEALKNLALAVEKGPQNLTNHLFYAESLVQARSYQEALMHVDLILAAGPDQSRIVEQLRDKKEAAALKKTIESKLK